MHHYADRDWQRATPAWCRPGWTRSTRVYGWYVRRTRCAVFAMKRTMRLSINRGAVHPAYRNNTRGSVVSGCTRETLHGALFRASKSAAGLVSFETSVAGRSRRSVIRLCFGPQTARHLAISRRPWISLSITYLCSTSASFSIRPLMPNSSEKLRSAGHATLFQNGK